MEEVGSDEAGLGDDDDGDEEDGEEDRQKTIPPELLTRLLHEFFTKEGTRITRDANVVVAKYMDVFVREAIARSAAEKDGKFMEVSSCSSLLRLGACLVRPGRPGLRMHVISEGIRSCLVPG